MDILWILFRSRDLAHPYLQCGVLGEHGEAKKIGLTKIGVNVIETANIFSIFARSAQNAQRGGYLYFIWPCPKMTPPNLDYLDHGWCGFLPPRP